MKDDYFDELVQLENEFIGLGCIASVSLDFFDELYPHLTEKRKRLLLLRRHHMIVMTRAVMAYNCRLNDGGESWKRNSTARVLVTPQFYQNWTLKEVNGYAKYPFIIHKVAEVYLITHLPTGLYTVAKKKLATAKALADDMATLPWMHGFFRVSTQKYREVSDVINRHPQD